MFTVRNSDKETRALTFANQAIAVLGLIVLGFPVTAALIKTTVFSWTLFVTATMQFVFSYPISRVRFQEIRRESN